MLDTCEFRSEQGFPTEPVVDSRRDRLFAATAWVFAERGYLDMDVAAILERAAVSRECFDTFFDNKLECLMETQRMASERFCARICQAGTTSPEWPEQIGNSVAEALDFAAEAPQFAVLLLPTRVIAEPDLAKGVRAINEFLARGLRIGRNYGEAARLPAITEEVLVGGVQSVIESELRAGRADQLPGLKSDITRSILVLYLGPNEAKRWS